MPLFNFSDLAMLWPFANEADKTLFLYKQYAQTAHARSHRRLPNNERAILVLTGALGHIVMDDSSPDIHTVEGPGRGKRASDTEALCKGRHVIYAGGPARNVAVRDFLKKCREQKFEISTHFSGGNEPRVLWVGEAKSKPVHEFRALYHDDQNTQVKVDYGLALLTFNPFDTQYKALLVAGLHGPGTLAAALSISGPDLSERIIRALVANFHLPPHLLGTVEVVVRTEVEEGGELAKNAAGRPVIELEYIAVNMLELFPSAKLDMLRVAYPSWPPRQDEVLHVARLRRTHDIEIRFEKIEGRSASHYRTDDSAFVVRGRLRRPPAREFVDYFSQRDVIVISPHSDDSVIGCGGLMYYLRNRELWSGTAPEKQRPNIHVLVMTASPGGVQKEEFEKYCQAIGMSLRQPALQSGLRSELCSQLRRNESLGEAFLLDAETHWLELRVDDPETEGQVGAKLEEIRGTEEARHRPFTLLIPPFEDLHPTHRWVRELVLRILRREAEYRAADVWVYESPWASLSPGNIDIILPLDKHAIFAKCQAISMHQSQEVRTHYTEVARTQARCKAEVVPEELFSFGGEARGWDFVEVFQDLRWQKKVFEER
ncbi:MAG: hypothetical protein A2V98_04485 [Planctomycetes bacterium RBG_16_64_12]|nr:MAG: hypothetical protein A2V98_04485 [Planctomycetes bacterium RBG_16_64_12]